MICLELTEDERWTVDLALGGERQLRREYLLAATRLAVAKPEDPAHHDSLAHHQRLMAATESVHRKLSLALDRPDAPVVLTQRGWEAARASELEQAIRAVLREPGIHHALAYASPEAMKRLADALEPRRPAAEGLMAGEAMMPVQAACVCGRVHSPDEGHDPEAA